MKTAMVGVVRVPLGFSADGTLGQFEQELPVSLVFSTAVAGNTSQKYGDPKVAREQRQKIIFTAHIEQSRIVAIKPILRKLGEDRSIRVVEVLRDIGNSDTVECDGLMTDSPSTALELRAADCYPICLIAPTKTGYCFALLHGGKAELGKQVVKQGVEAMCSRFNVLASQVVMLVGPGIGPCCYRNPKLGNTPVDLREQIEHQAAEVGIVHPLYFADYCTCCSRGPDRKWIFFSHRRSDELGQTEEPESRFMAVIGPIL
jgi:copper oxidase (laccase) domain-containing protein